MFVPIVLLAGLILAGAVVFSALFAGSERDETVIDISTPGGHVEVEQDPETDNVTIEIKPDED